MEYRRGSSAKARLLKSASVTGQAREHIVRAVTDLSDRRASMPDSRTPQTPQRRVGVYERLGQVGGFPAKTIGIAVVLLIILIAIIMALT
jgi:hypothetical protein